MVGEGEKRRVKNGWRRRKKNEMNKRRVKTGWRRREKK